MDEQKLQAELARVKLKKHHVISTTSTFESVIAADVSISFDVEEILNRPLDSSNSKTRILDANAMISGSDLFTRRDKNRKPTRARNHQRNAKSTNL